MRCKLEIKFYEFSDRVCFKQVMQGHRFDSRKIFSKESSYQNKSGGPEGNLIFALF